MSLSSSSGVVAPNPSDMLVDGDPIVERDEIGRTRQYRVSTLVVVLLLWASSSPSVLYPLWGARWGFSSLTQTSIYSCYPVALILVLLFGGGISDRIGRPRAMIFGMAIIALAVLTLIVAPHTGWLYAGRVLQGLGTGLAIGASNAAIVENEPTRNMARASAMITVASAAGLIVGPIVTGALAEYAPFPLHLGLTVLLVLIASAIALLVAIRTAGGPGRRAVHAERWRPRAITVPRRTWPVFGVAALAVTAAYAASALGLSLGAQMARELVQTRNALVIGLLLAVTPVGMVVVAIGLRQPRPAGAMLAGGLVTTAGIGCLLLTAVTGQLGLFVAALALNGLGQGLLTLGGLGLATVHAPPEHLGQTLSAVYLVAYLGQAVTAVSVGLLAVRLDLHEALYLFAPLMMLGCLAASALGWRELRRWSVGIAV